MEGLFKDEIGNNPASDLPLGAAVLGVEPEDWISLVDLGGEIKMVVKANKVFVVADIDGGKKIDFGIELRDASLEVDDFIL